MANVSKIHHKASVWSRHGKWSGRRDWCCLLNRLAAERLAKAKANKLPMYDSVYECLAASGIR